jgi:hypothetical protein
MPRAPLAETFGISRESQNAASVVPIEVRHNGRLAFSGSRTRAAKRSFGAGDPIRHDRNNFSLLAFSVRRLLEG